MTWTAVTDDEVRMLGLDGKFGQSTAWLVRNASQTQLSIARHYGGLTWNDQHYTYMPATDELISDDALKAVQKLRKQHKALDTMAEISQQLGLYE